LRRQLVTTVAVLAAFPAGAAAAPSVTEYSSGLQPGNASRLGAIVDGQDGNLWFTDDGPVPAVGKITPAGQITEYSTGLQANNGSHLVDITAGPDGNLWFTDNGPVPAVGKITPACQITEYSTGLQANNASCPAGMTTGPDGNVWFTDQGSRCGSGLGANMIGKITPESLSPPDIAKPIQQILRACLSPSRADSLHRPRRPQQRRLRWSPTRQARSPVGHLPDGLDGGHPRLRRGS
jgi:streptogramin lyase